MKRPVAFAAALLLASLAALAEDTPGSGTEKAVPPKPPLHLDVSTYYGFLPLKLTLDADLGAAVLSEAESCSVVAEWVGEQVNPGILSGTKRMRRNTKETLPCVAGRGPADLPRTFRKEMTLKEPGVYTYRVLLKMKDGRTLSSNNRDVEVRRSDSELKVGVTGTDPARPR